MPSGARPSPRGEVVQRSFVNAAFTESAECSPRAMQGGTGTRMDRGMPARLRVSGRPTPKLGGAVWSDACRESTSETSAASRSARVW